MGHSSIRPPRSRHLGLNGSWTGIGDSRSSPGADRRPIHRASSFSRNPTPGRPGSRGDSPRSALGRVIRVRGLRDRVSPIRARHAVGDRRFARRAPRGSRGIASANSGLVAWVSPSLTPAGNPRQEKSWIIRKFYHSYVQTYDVTVVGLGSPKVCPSISSPFRQTNRSPSWNGTGSSSWKR